MNRGSVHTSFTKTSNLLLLLLVACGWSCTKQTETITPPVQPPVVVSPPTGVIESFVLTDSLVPFYTGSTAKWLVSGTNTNTVITFNGVIVGNYGVLDTGPLKQNTVFTLAVNNGKKASVTLYVADSITTLLWNKGKRLRQTKLELYVVPAGKTDPVWVDTPMTVRIADQRIYFNLDGTSKSIQSTANANVAQGDAGKFVITAMQTAFIWQGTTYILGTLNDTVLVTVYDTVIGGNKVHARNTYAYE